MKYRWAVAVSNIYIKAHKRASIDIYVFRNGVQFAIYGEFTGAVHLTTSLKYVDSLYSQPISHTHTHNAWDIKIEFLRKFGSILHFTNTKWFKSLEPIYWNVQNIFHIIFDRPIKLENIKEKKKKMLNNEFGEFWINKFDWFWCCLIINTTRTDKMGPTWNDLSMLVFVLFTITESYLTFSSNWADDDDDDDDHLIHP